MNEIKKNDLIQARKFCNNFRFIQNLISINETNSCNIYPKKLELGKKIVKNLTGVFRFRW